jgi:hypothetical protein
MAVELAFWWGRVDYAQVEKICDQSPKEQRRYSPPVCLGSKKRRVMGNPDPDMVSTSHVERGNLTMRMGTRRFTRHNFCRVHTTLTKDRGGLKTTPAMAAGLADRVSTVYHLLKLLQWE